MNVIDLADALGERAAIDEALFLKFNEWADASENPARTVAFNTIARWLGEHADAAVGLLPDSPALSAQDKVVLPDHWDKLIAESTNSAAAAIIDRRLAFDAELLAQLGAVSDSPVIRHLAHTRLDLEFAANKLAG